jgi:5-methylcytosine-specific restriction endonuclease McrA
MATSDRHVLLLNQNYEPLSVCRARRALVLVLLRKAEPVETYGAAVRAVSMSMPLPSVLRLNYYVRVRRREVPLTKRNVLRRDNNTCLYCGRRLAVMTTDHVVPRSLGGADTWENLVCACPQCNAEKGSRTPAQASMRLRRRPKTPHYITFAVNALGVVPENWRQYLFLS